MIVNIGCFGRSSADGMLMTTINTFPFAVPTNRHGLIQLSIDKIMVSISMETQL
jgi:hypothetical protein